MLGNHNMYIFSLAKVNNQLLFILLNYLLFYLAMKDRAFITRSLYDRTDHSSYPQCPFLSIF